MRNMGHRTILFSSLFYKIQILSPAQYGTLQNIPSHNATMTQPHTLGVTPAPLLSVKTATTGDTTPPNKKYLQ